ncbi:SLC13 family permease [Denitrobaculum tricleocarpae]|uniref:SLC13 family permease n=1 Tax=Denitrobaculum tricleocarpae TaxID=2591009 RepID=A0A545U2M0_9PROT|nr:SLC13 family permease [Denitrobaculum tricleocarpae]TQV83653.1 SLC13 family permease [Denitrobaculum tricleocarpae]
MTTDQIVLFALLFAVFGLLLWGRYRYDLVAFAALVVAVVTGSVPTEDAFSGFGHPAVVIIALVLIVSRGLVLSGAIDLITRYLIDGSRKLSSHIAVMSGLGAFFSAFMNNVGALALLMPVELQASAKAKRSPALTLMPLSFATILGGLVTLIGTPPNIIIAAFREKSLGESYSMFDFAPVGLACAVAGVAFVALVGWRLLPGERGKHDTAQELMDLQGYIAEIKVPEASPAVGRKVSDLDEEAADCDAHIVGLVRRGKRLPGTGRREEISAGDILVVEAGPEAIDKLVGSLKLEYAGSERRARVDEGDQKLMEVVVPRHARIDGRSALDVNLLYRHGITLLGVSRSGKRFRERLRKLVISAGDVLLLLGPAERLPEVASWLGTLPLAERGLEVIQRDKAAMAAGLFAVAIILASLGVIYLPVALAGVVIGYVLLKIMPLRQIYDFVEWPVIVLLACLIPIGQALEASGGTALIANGIVAISAGWSPAVVLTLLMIVTMTLSDVLNNTATTVIAAPIAIDIAERLGVSADPFLMAVAVAASCAFLTPIGHKNNTLVMGPGGYAFGDYWRMGLPLEILIVAVAVPVILVVWPF